MIFFPLKEIDKKYLMILSLSPVVMILDIENTVRKVRAYKLHTLQTRKICFSPKNGAVSVSKMQFYFWV